MGDDGGRENAAAQRGMVSEGRRGREMDGGGGGLPPLPKEGFLGVNFGG